MVKKTQTGNYFVGVVKRAAAIPWRLIKFAGRNTVRLGWAGYGITTYVAPKVIKCAGTSSVTLANAGLSASATYIPVAANYLTPKIIKGTWWLGSAAVITGLKWGWTGIWEFTKIVAPANIVAPLGTGTTNVISAAKWGINRINTLAGRNKTPAQILAEIQERIMNSKIEERQTLLDIDAVKYEIKNLNILKQKDTEEMNDIIKKAKDAEVEFEQEVANLKVLIAAENDISYDKIAYRKEEFKTAIARKKEKEKAKIKILKAKQQELMNANNIEELKAEENEMKKKNLLKTIKIGALSVVTAAILLFILSFIYSKLNVSNTLTVN